MYKVVIRCAKCYSNNWVKRHQERRNNLMPEHLDLECGSCGAIYCAKNRYWSWEDDSPQQLFKFDAN